MTTPDERTEPNRTLILGVAAFAIGLSAMTSVIGAGLAISGGYAVHEYSESPAAQRWAVAAVVAGVWGWGMTLVSGPSGRTGLFIVLGLVAVLVAAGIAFARRKR